MSQTNSKFYNFWYRTWENIDKNYLEVIAITSRAKGKNTSLGKPYGVGKSSLALWLSYIFHYWERYGYNDMEDMDTEDLVVWNTVLKRMTYDKLELIPWSVRRERIPALVWDDVQNTAPALQHVPKEDKVISSHLTTSRTSMSLLIMTMPSLSSISKPFRELANYEVIVYQRGKYEVQYIEVRKDFYDPYHDKARMILLDEGEFEPVPRSIYRQYLAWREAERRRVLKRYMNTELEKKYGVIEVPVDSI